MTGLIVAIAVVICCAVPILMLFAAWSLAKESKEWPPWFNEDRKIRHDRRETINPPAIIAEPETKNLTRTDS
jgi:hypothetical protein